MNGSEFINTVKRLGLKPSEYIVIGSGILGALGIREVNDVDLVVAEGVFREYEQSGNWTKKHFDDGSYYLLQGVYEVGLDWDSQNAVPNLEELKQDEIILEDVPFVSLERLKRWKLIKARDKDLADVQLIDDYQKNQQ